MVPLYHKSYWIPCNINDALGRSYVSMMRSRFCVHHRTIMLLSFPLQPCEESEGDLHVIVCPLVAVWAYYIKVPYLLVWHRKWLCMRLNKVMLCFSFGSSRQSLKVREVKYIPGDPAITCPVLFKGSCSLLSLA